MAEDEKPKPITILSTCFIKITINKAKIQKSNQKTNSFKEIVFFFHCFNNLRRKKTITKPAIIC